MGLMHAEGLGSSGEHQENVWGQEAVSAWDSRGGGGGQPGWGVGYKLENTGKGAKLTYNTTLFCPPGGSWWWLRRCHRGYVSSTVGHEDAPSQVLPREGWGWQRCLSPAMPGAMLLFKGWRWPLHLSQEPEEDRSPQPSKGGLAACQDPCRAAEIQQ